jgi:N-methylhydantoinase A
VSWKNGAGEAEADFAAAHERLYGFALEAPIELVTLRVEATGAMPSPPRPELAPGSGASPAAMITLQLPGGAAEAPLFERASFGAGDTFEGPAIVTQLDATTLVLPGWTGEVHETGAILLTRSDADERATS